MANRITPSASRPDAGISSVAFPAVKTGGTSLRPSLHIQSISATAARSMRGGSPIENFFSTSRMILPRDGRTDLRYYI